MCHPSPGTYRRQPINATLLHLYFSPSHQCFCLSLPLSLKAMKKISSCEDKQHFLKRIHCQIHGHENLLESLLRWPQFTALGILEKLHFEINIATLHLHFLAPSPLQTRASMERRLRPPPTPRCPGSFSGCPVTK